MAVITTSFNVATGDGCECCGTTPTDCACALLIPEMPDGRVTSPFASYSDAATAITDLTSNCVGYIENPILPFGPTSFSFTMTVPASNAFDFTATISGGIFLARIARMYASLNLVSGSTLTVSSNVADGGGDVILWSCDGTLIDSHDLDLGTQNYTFSIPTSGGYILRVYYGTTNDWTYTFPVSSDDVLFANPVIALWDDSGTTRQLEACPKLYLPTLTESSGSWLASCSDASALITNQVIDCLAYSEVSPFTSGSASGTAPFVVSITANQSAFIPWASFNGAAGDVWTFTFTRSASPIFVVQALIYDDTGNLVEALSGSSPLVSSAIPYSGRYIVKMFMVGLGSSAITATVSVSSSGTLGVNPVQVLYDTGFSCPSRLNCGDSCP